MSPPSWEEKRSIVIEHVKELHNFYGDFMGLRFARKHVSWYMQLLEPDKKFRSIFNGLESTEDQLVALTRYFDNLTKERV
jgi:tRNA-dihydrouridine synthase B